MMKKKGKIVVMIIIIILCISWIGIGFLEEIVQPMGLGVPYDWEFDRNNSNNEETWISGRINITNLPENPVIDLALEHTKGEIEFENETFGEISFINKTVKDRLKAGETINEVSIKSGKTKSFDFYIRALNYKIPRLWNIYLNNGEKGKLKIKIIFNFSIADTNIKWESPSLGNKSFNKSILYALSRKIENLTLNNKSEKRFFGIGMWLYKENESKEFFITPTFILKPNISFFRTKIELVDDLILDKNSEKYTFLKQNITISTRNKILFFCIFPLFQYKVYVNDIELGEITIKKNNEKSSRIRLLGRKTRDFILEIKLNDIKLDDWFSSHMLNGEKTNVEVYIVRNGKFILGRPIISFPIERKISDVLENISLKLKPINISFLPQILKDIRTFIVMIIIGLTVLVIADAVWEKIT